MHTLNRPKRYQLQTFQLFAFSLKINICSNWKLSFKYVDNVDCEWKKGFAIIKNTQLTMSKNVWMYVVDLLVLILWKLREIQEHFAFVCWCHVCNEKKHFKHWQFIGKWDYVFFFSRNENCQLCIDPYHNL